MKNIFTTRFCIGYSKKLLSYKEFGSLTKITREKNVKKTKNDNISFYNPENKSSSQNSLEKNLNSIEKNLNSNSQSQSSNNVYHKQSPYKAYFYELEIKKQAKKFEIKKRQKIEKEKDKSYQTFSSNLENYNPNSNKTAFVMKKQVKNKLFHIDLNEANSLIEKINLLKSRKMKVVHSLYEGDLVIITSGKYKGQSGRIKTISRTQNTAIIPGVNLKLKLKHIYGLYHLTKIDPNNKRQYHPSPISINDLSLVSPFANKIIKPEIIPNKNMPGHFMRICPLTKKEIPVPPHRRYIHSSLKSKKFHYSCKDTKKRMIPIITFKGYDYESIFEDFLVRKKEKKFIDKDLILRDRISSELI